MSSHFDMSYLEDLIAHMNLLLNVMYGIVRELDINPRLNIYIYTNIINECYIACGWLAIVEFYFII